MTCINDSNRYVYRIEPDDGSVIFIAWTEDPIIDGKLKDVVTLPEFFSVESTRQTMSIDLSDYVSRTQMDRASFITQLRGLNDPITPPVEIVLTKNVELSNEPILLIECRLTLAFTLHPNQFLLLNVRRN